MENKYYTPDLSEFHIGFEFETTYVLMTTGAQRKSGEWAKTKLKSYDTRWFFDSYQADAAPTEFRVKFLDREDIESLGFKMIEPEKSNYGGKLFSCTKECWLGSNSPTEYRLHLGQHSKVLLTSSEHTSYGVNEQEMQLTIKNASELKRVLKQIGYENTEKD